MSQSILARNAMIDARNALLNGGSVEIRTGAAASVDLTPTGTVSVIYTLGSPAFSPAGGGSATVNLVAEVNTMAANAGGQVHYVAKASGGTVISNGSAGTGAEQMQLNTLTWSIGDPVTMTGWSVSQPA